MIEQILRLFTQVGDHYKEQGFATSEVHKNHDVHAFYRISREPTRVIHVQGYPGMSSEKEARVWARLMDYDKMMEIRGGGAVSIGNEHAEPVQSFPNFESGIIIPYEPKVLEERLSDNIGWKKSSEGKITEYQFQTDDGTLYVQLHREHQAFGGCDILEVGIKGRDHYMFTRDTFELQGQWGELKIAEEETKLISQYFSKLECLPDDEMRSLMNLSDLKARIQEH